MTVKTEQPKYVYVFSNKETEGDNSMRHLLGGKGAILAEISRAGFPVPPGFTITTEVCTYYCQNRKTFPRDLDPQVKAGMAFIESIAGMKFGDSSAMPLLVSVRASALDSMPGLMDTILNLGVNDDTVMALAEATKNARFAWDCYRRFIQMYGDLVIGVQKQAGEDYEPFESVIQDLKHERYVEEIEDTVLTADDLMELVIRFKRLIKERTGKEFPQDPWKQLRGAIGAVFDSWMNDRAVVYRRKFRGPSEVASAVTVQAMVYGNTGDNSGSGVAFTRNPNNGAKDFHGEFLANAQGEDVVAGSRMPEPIGNLSKAMPATYKELERLGTLLERHLKDIQDFEFTVQDGKVFILCTRDGRRNDLAAMQIVVDLARDGVISRRDAVTRVSDSGVLSRVGQFLDAAAKGKPFTKLLGQGEPNAAPGMVVGFLAFDEIQVEQLTRLHKPVVYATRELTYGEDQLLEKCAGAITFSSGMGNRAAMWARRGGKTAVIGMSGAMVEDNKLVVGAGQACAGQSVFLDGYRGEVRVEGESGVGSASESGRDDPNEHLSHLYELLKSWASERS